MVCHGRKWVRDREDRAEAECDRHRKLKVVSQYE